MVDCASSTREFYVAGKGVSLGTRYATAVDWMAAAFSFPWPEPLLAIRWLGVSDGVDGGYVLLAVLLGLFGEVWQVHGSRFVGDRYESNTVRFLVMRLFVSFTYVAGQMAASGWSSRLGSAG